MSFNKQIPDIRIDMIIDDKILNLNEMSLQIISIRKFT